MDVKWTYFQYRKAFNYPVYLRFKSDDLHDRFKHLLGEMGFNALTDVESKKISLQRLSTKILSVQTASARLQHQICGSELLDKYGMESLSLQVGVPVYTYRRVGLMVMPPSRIWWELGLSSDIHQTDQMVGLRVLLVRFLAHALADLGVLCYWGTFKDDYVIIMKQAQSFGEAVLIDINKKMIFSNGGEEKLHLGLKILRKDKDNLSGSHLKREDLISFLSVSTCLLSFTGITPAMRKSIMDLSLVSSASYSYRAPSLDV
jgi:hypothetical protein